MSAIARAAGELGKRVRGLMRVYGGLGLLFAWLYSTFYSCVLVQNPHTIRESERYWAVALLVAAIEALVLLVLLRRSRRIGGMRCWALFMAAAAAVSSVFIYAGFELDPIEHGLTNIGAALAGVALPFLLLLWGDVLRQRDEESIEFCIPAAFLVSLAIYLPVVAAKNIVSVAVVALCPLASVMLALGVVFATPKERRQETGGGLFGRKSTSGNLAGTPFKSRSVAESAARRSAPSALPLTPRARLHADAGLWKTSALFALLWFGFAFFRGIASPTYFTDRFDHYLLPFVCAGILAFCIMLLTTFRARETGLFTTYRWVLPFLCAGYALLFVTNEAVGRFAFTFCFVGLVALKLGSTAVVCKICSRRHISIEQVLLPLLAGIGVGVCAGTACGLWVLGLGQAASGSGAILFVPIAAVTAVMAWGCDTRDLMACEQVAPLRAAREDSVSGGVVVGRIDRAPSSIDSIAATQAQALTARFGLSEREQEILGYLLAGRSRPYVRDALHLSLNTVNTHVRNIFAKADVHSQQELLTLARTTVPSGAAAPADPAGAAESSGDRGERPSLETRAARARA